MSLDLKLKLSLNSKNAKSVLVTNNETMKISEFPSAAKHIGVDSSTLRKCIKYKKVCKGYTVVRKSK